MTTAISILWTVAKFALALFVASFLSLFAALLLFGGLKAFGVDEKAADSVSLFSMGGIWVVVFGAWCQEVGS